MYLSRTISVAQGEFVSIKIKTPLQEVNVVDPLIAHSVVVDANHVILLPDDVGRTTLTLFNEQANTIAHVNVVVTPRVPTDESEKIHSKYSVTLPEIYPTSTLSVVEGQIEETLEIPQRSAIVIETNKDTENFKVSDRNIMAIWSMNPNSVYILGEELGRSTLSFDRDGTADDFSIQINVVPSQADTK